MNSDNREIKINEIEDKVWTVTIGNNTVFTTNVYEKAKEVLIETKREKFKKDYPFKRKVFKKKN